MKKPLLLTFLSILLFSCKSEYEERLAQAKVVRVKIEKIQSMDEYGINTALQEEINDLHDEIVFLSKVSGNENKFLEELFN